MSQGHYASSLRVLGLLPLPYTDRGGFWHRDVGLIVQTLRALGNDAKLVAYRTKEAESSQFPVLLGTADELNDGAWWRSHAPDAVISNTWGAPRFARMRAAALGATSCFVEKLDTDGIRSPWIWPSQYFVETWTHLRDRGNPAWKRYGALGLALLRTFAVGAFPSLLDRRMATLMAELPKIVAESPLAAERIRRFLRSYSLTPPRIESIPHPVSLRDLGFKEGIQARENRVVAVGRWHEHQKNFPLLLAVLGRFLRIHPEWRAEIIGQLPENAKDQVRRLIDDGRDRLQLRGVVPHEEIGTIYWASKIFLITSRHESFNIAAAEALCCGCSVVGPVEIASTEYFAGTSSGTVAPRRRAVHLVDALCTEAEHWSAGSRAPEQIAAYWRQEVGAESVSRRLLELAIRAKS